MIKIFSLLFLMFSLHGSEIYATLNVKAEQSANLAFDASGIVKKVNVDIADEVKRGDVLAVLDNDDILAMLERAKTTLKFALRDYERQLKIKHLIDAGKFDVYALKYEDAKNQLSYQQALYDKTFLRAPFDGVIFEKDIEVGDTVSGMMLKTVLKIQTPRKRKIVLEFDQKYHKSVQVGQAFKYSVNGDETVYEGVISKIYPHADSDNRKIKAEVEAKDFMVGLFGDGHITVADKK